MPDSFDLTPVDHDPFAEESSPQLERIPPVDNPVAQQERAARGIASFLGDITGISDAARAWRGEMTEEEQRNFALTAAAGMLPGARALKPAVKAAEEIVPRLRLPVRPASEDLYEVADANFLHGQPAGNRTVPIESLKGGATLSQPIEADRVDRIASQMAGENGYIRRLITDDQGNVIEGQHRLEALRKLGVDQVPVSVIKDLSRGYDLDAMRNAVQQAGNLHPDQVHQIIRRALESADEAGSPAKALAEYDMPAPFTGQFKAALNAMQPQPSGIKAFHGSPYDFERFDLSKIGTGEGAQAYGHGLYLAENPETAEFYKQSVSQKPTLNGKPLLDQHYDTATSTGHPYLDKMIKESFGDMDLLHKTLDANIIAGPAITDSPFWQKAAAERVANSQSALKHLNELEASGAIGTVSPGRTYEVSIAADPDHFLHWDKPLKDQSPIVQQTIDDILKKHGSYAMSAQTGEGVMRDLEVALHKPGQGHLDRAAAAQELRSAGIPGIKYLDQGSRNTGAYSVTTKLGDKGPEYSVTGPGNISHGSFDTQEAARAFANQKNAEGQTHNYVIFDDRLINIIKKYGLAGLTTMGAAHFSTTPVEGDPFKEEVKRAAGGRVLASNIDREPTEAQKKAGNYAKDHVSIHGLDISIENAKGHERSGVDKGGARWSVKMPCAYGCIKKTEGRDGDHVDVYLGPHTKSPKVFVIDQKNAETGRFDEHKTFIGFASDKQVRACYSKAFSDGKAHLRLGHIEEMTVEQFKHWLEKGDTTKPIKNGEDKKLPHKAVGYVATSPHAGKYCGACSMFVLSGPHCTLVADPVRAVGYCRRFFKGTPHAS